MKPFVPGHNLFFCVPCLLPPEHASISSVIGPSEKLSGISARCSAFANLFHLGGHMLPGFAKIARLIATLGAIELAASLC